MVPDHIFMQWTQYVVSLKEFMKCRLQYEIRIECDPIGFQGKLVYVVRAFILLNDHNACIILFLNGIVKKEI